MNNAPPRFIFTIVSLLMIVCISTQNALAIRAGAFYVPIKNGQNNAPPIDLAKDHYSVEVVGGKISSQDGIIDTIMSSNSTLIGSFKQTIVVGSGRQLAINKVYQEEDIRNRINRPIQTGIALVDRIPGDYGSLINIRYVVNRDRRISEVFKALEQEQSALAEAGTDILAGPWLGYAKVVTKMTETLFRAGRDKFPIEWDGQIKITDVMVGEGLMQPHYLVLVAPKRDDDWYYNSIQTSELSVSGNRLMRAMERTEGGSWPPLEVERTYIILKVSKSDSFDIKRLMDGSTAPWAAFGRKQFSRYDDSGIKKEELGAFAASLLNQIGSLGDLLQDEVYFSSYDKAVALVYYGGSAKDRVEARCAAFGVPSEQCPTASLDGHVRDYLTRHGIPPNSAKIAQVKTTAEQLQRAR